MMEAQSAASCILQPALPAWGATVFRLPADYAGHVSIHTPRVGSDAGLAGEPVQRKTFQSTLPVWGATRGVLCTTHCKLISIHTPRMGSDKQIRHEAKRLQKFQSTLPVWGATLHQALFLLRSYNFNPHSPYGERPDTSNTSAPGVTDFNPHSPYRERRVEAGQYEAISEFQSTLPV